MPKSDANTKADRLYRLQQLFEQPGQRLRTCDIADKLGITDDTVKSYIDELSEARRLPLTKEGQYWVLVEGGRIQQLRVYLNIPEASALYIAGRLLSQIHDERNMAVITALSKLVDALPEAIRAYQRAMIEMAEQRQANQPDRSKIFSELTLGWAQHKRVRLLYAPLGGKRRFECSFAPYLLEPSGIGRTIYALGHCNPPGELRTLKLERIEYAHLTEETFEVEESFDGPALLKKAWGVMYGEDECVEVQLRFTSWVEQRVKETLWHPSQQIADTPDGCVMTVQIGDTLEIENWIRGWGADCEVLKPTALREKIAKQVRRLAHTYGVLQPTSSLPPDEPDTDLLAHLFGGG